MNAPICTALLLARAGTVDGADSQPLIPATAKLLYQRYEHNGLLVDLYGDFDASGYTVEYVGLHNSVDRADLAVWLSKDELLQLSAFCNRRLPSTEELLHEQIAENRAERIKWQRAQAGP